MNLLYFWFDSYSCENLKDGYNFSSKYKFNFNENDGLIYYYNESYIENFYANNIFDIMAIVGENGSGKTSLLNDLMFILSEIINSEELITKKYVIVFEDQNNKIIVLSNFDFINKNKNVLSIKKSMQDYRQYIKNFEKYKIVYFHNAMSLNDYSIKRYGYIEDFSLCGSMRKISKHNAEMHYTPINADPIVQYYNNKLEKIISFIISENNIEAKTLLLGDGMGCFDFPTPTKVKITFADNIYTYKYIKDEIYKLSHDADLSENYSQPKENFNNNGHNFIDKVNEYFKSKNTIKSKISENLILNALRWILVLQTQSSYKIEYCKLIFSKSDILFHNFHDEHEVISNVTSYFQAIKTELKKTNNWYANSIDDFYEFSSWLYDKDLSDEFIFNNSKDRMILMQLYKYYAKTNLPYPYLHFDFGLSTGEFNFLNLFSDLHSLKEGIIKNITTTGSIECPHILLIFDEADLYLHPKWQQQYIKRIIGFLKERLSQYDFQILISTHSPIMLSDFPKDNVIYLPEQSVNLQTFGNNIHSLFLNSFFLHETGTMGAFAESKINGLVSYINNYNQLSQDNGEDILKTIHKIGDNYIQDKILQLYHSKIDNPQEVRQNIKESDEGIFDAIKILKQQRDDLNALIKQMEQKYYDKD